MSTSRKQAAARPEKKVNVLARTQFQHVDKVEYLVLRSDNMHKCTTTLVNGRFFHCTCPAQWGTCYHGKQLVEIEAEFRKAEETRLLLLALMAQYRAAAEAERDRLQAELVQYRADQEAAAIQAATDDSSSGDPATDPWFGFTAAQRFEAWRNFENSMIGLGS